MCGVVRVVSMRTRAYRSQYPSHSYRHLDSGVMVGKTFQAIFKHAGHEKDIVVESEPHNDAEAHHLHTCQREHEKSKMNFGH
jgi:hypothetical protein